MVREHTSVSNLFRISFMGFLPIYGVGLVTTWICTNIYIAQQDSTKRRSVNLDLSLYQVIRGTGSSSERKKHWLLLGLFSNDNFKLGISRRFPKKGGVCRRKSRDKKKGGEKQEGKESSEEEEVSREQTNKGKQTNNGRGSIT